MPKNTLNLMLYVYDQSKYNLKRWITNINITQPLNTVENVAYIYNLVILENSAWNAVNTVNPAKK